MTSHPKSPLSPDETLEASQRWLPANEQLRETTADKLLPPLAAQLRNGVKVFRDGGHTGSEESV